MRRNLAILASLAIGSAFAVASPATALTSVAASAPGRPASSAACGLGGSLLTPTVVRTDRLGVKYYAYRAIPGMVSKVPPSGLTAAHVTPALLADIGLESASDAKKPVTAASRQNLDRAAISLAAAGAPKLCAGNAGTRAMLGGGQPPRRTAASSAERYNVDTDNWGGYGIDESEFGAGINAAEGAWVVGQHHTSGAHVKEATWVGLGSLDDQTPTNVTGLIQAGVAIITNPIIRTGEPTPPAGFTSWIEVLGVNSSTGGLTGCSASGNNGCNPIYNAGDSTRPGDVVLVRVWYASSSQACFLMVDYTHSGGSIPQRCLQTAVYDHTSAEWINESDFSDGYLYDNPGTITWNTQNISAAFNSNGPWSAAFAGGAYQDVIMFTDGIDNAGVPSCSGNHVLLSKGVNAGTSTSQIASYPVSGCD
jgi:hypothetical protein